MNLVALSFLTLLLAALNNRMKTLGHSIALLSNHFHNNEKHCGIQCLNGTIESSRQLGSQNPPRNSRKLYMLGSSSSKPRSCVF
jgi:hypothetical protein